MYYEIDFKKNEIDCSTRFHSNPIAARP